MAGTEGRTIAIREIFRKTRTITGIGTIRILHGCHTIFRVRILLLQEKFALIAERMAVQINGHRSGKVIMR
jgi:hypothetical protein